ncbi:MAG: carbohydrate kinase family protein, partial [Firmicutes bacterium]|nr:carbohydrate kinase family protein [Candidatus Colimorpha enterica]
GLDKDNNYVRMDSIDIPRSLIVGTTGAGDAFCSGALYAAYKGMSLEEGMYFATGVASTSLFAAGASESVTDYQGVLDLMKQYPVPKKVTYKL